MDKVAKSPVWRNGLVETVVGGIVTWNLVMFGVGPGLGWGLAVIVGIWLVWRMMPNKVTWHNSVAIVGTVAALLVAGRANGFVQAYDGAMAMVCLAVLVIALIVQNAEWKVERLIGYGWEVLVDAWDHTWAVLGTVKQGQQPSNAKMSSIIKTVIISGILLVVFGTILSAADPEFGKQLTTIFHSAGGRIVTSVVVALVMMWWLTIKITSDKHGEKWLGWVGFYELVVPIGLVGLMVGVFLAFQTRYLFASHESFAAFPESYSEYVRKGFAELMLATALGGGLAYSVWLQTQRRVDEMAQKVAMWVNSIWIVEIGLVLLSAAWRNGLYIDAYGYTRTRLIGEGFLVWLAGMLVALLVLVLVKKAKSEWLTITLGVMTVLVGVYFNLVNMDAKILAKQPTRWKEKDVFYLSNLSEDGIGGWRDVVTCGEQEVVRLKTIPVMDKNERIKFAGLQLAVETLRLKRDRLDKKYGQTVDPRTGNLSEWYAYEQMRADNELFYTRLDKLNADVHNSWLVNEERRWILYDFDYPFVDVKMRQ